MREHCSALSSKPGIIWRHPTLSFAAAPVLARHSSVGVLRQRFSTAQTPVCHMISVWRLESHRMRLLCRLFCLWLGCCKPSVAQRAFLFFFAPLSLCDAACLVWWRNFPIALAAASAVSASFSAVCHASDRRLTVIFHPIGAHCTCGCTSVGLTHCISFKAPVRAMFFFSLLAPRAYP
jgi:hypothetical protein